MAHLAPPFPPDVPTLGRGRYVLVSRIGEGGMAAVYRCYDRKLRVWRAVKVLLPEHASRASVRERFESEALTMAPLEHENLVRVYDVGHAAGLPYLVMELVDGGTLAQFTDRYGVMGPRLVVEVGLQLVRGLSAVHAHGVVHRDVKPKNVLVSSSGVCKLTDFGIAQIDADGRTRPGAMLGTLEYMAPEQRIDAKSVDARADLYGLGATLWHLLRAEDRSDLFLVGTDEMLLHGIPPTLHPVLLRCIAYDRNRRYTTATEVAQALKQALDGMPPDPPEGHDLFVDLSEHEVDVGQGAFGELEAMLDQDSVRARPIPYTMSARRSELGEDDDALPDWVDRTVSAPIPLPDMVVEAPGASVTVLEPVAAGPVKVLNAPVPEPAPPVVEEPPPPMEPGPPPPTEPGPPPSAITPIAPAIEDPPPVDEPVEVPEEEEEEPVEYGWGTWILVPLFGMATVFAVVLTVMLASAAAALGAAESATMNSRAQLYQVLQEERPIVDELAAFGVDRDLLERSYLAFAEPVDESSKLVAANALARLVEGERGRIDPESSGVYEVQLRRRLDRIRDARQRSAAARDQWRAAANRRGARWVLALGLESAPPD